MKIGEYNQMMAYLTRPEPVKQEPIIIPPSKPEELLEIQEQNRKNRLRNTLDNLEPVLMDESVDFIEREELSEGTFKPRLERGKKLFDYINNLPKGSIVDYNKLANKFNVSPATVYRAVQTRPDLKTAGVEKNKAISQEIKEAYDKLKKNLKRNPTKNELIRATGRNAEAINTAQKTFKLNFFNKPGVSALPPDVLKESVQKGVDKRRAKKEITQPSSFVEEGKLKKVNFPNKKMEDAFKANVELYHSFPQGSTEAKKVGATLDSFKQFYPDGVTDDVLRRHVAFFRNKLNLKFPKQEYEGQYKKQKIINKRREKLIKEVSGFLQERKIGKAKRELGFGRSGENLDLAHRASLKQFKDFGLDYLTDNLGLDTRIINQEILPPLENEINSLHKERMKLIKGIKPGEVPKEVSKKLEDINIKLSNISMKTNGALQAVLLDEKTLKPFVFNKNYANVLGQGLVDKPVKELSDADIEFISKTFPGSAKQAKAMKIPTATDSKNIAKQLASFGFKCSASEGGACDNPMNYLEDIKKQQALAKGSGNVAASAAKKLSAGKAIFREVLGPAALTFELATAVPITYLGYKAGLPPSRIIADATYGLFGDTEKARLKKEAVKAGIDTSEIQKSLDFEKASEAMINLARQEGDFRGPDDEMLFPQQYEKGEEDFYKAVGAFTDEEGNISKDVFKRFGSQLQQLREFIAKTDEKTAAERASKIASFGVGDYLDLKAGGRVGFADGPKDPGRRTFIKLMAGIASLPILGKFFKFGAAPKVVKLSNTTTKMPDWFPSFVDKAFEKGIAKKIDADITEVEIPELPSVKVRKYDDGRIEVEGKNGYGEPYEIDYTPPGYEVIDETTGKAVKTPGEFQANDTVYRRVGPEGDDFDVDFEVVDDVEQILGGDSTKLEGFAKGTKDSKYTVGQRNIDEADAIQERADVFELEDIDIDYED